MSDAGYLLDVESMGKMEEEARVLNARENFPAFCEYCMVDDQARPWKFTDHQYRWSERYMDDSLKLLLDIASRGAAKSTTLQALALFLLGRNPNTCIKYVCGSDDIAIDRLKFVHTNILANKRYQRVFPHVKPLELAEWNKHKITIERPAASGLQDASFECSSVTAAGTGGRAHILMFDDIIDATSALVRPKVMAHVKQMVENDWMPLLFPGGRAMMIGTFWSFDPPDIYVEYVERPDWNALVQPACGIDAAGNLTGPYLWEERWNKDALEERRRQVGEEAFQQQYLLKGAVVRSQFFSPEHIANAKDSGTNLGHSPFEVQKVVIGVDVATSLKRGGSYSCIFVVGIGPDGEKIPLSIVRLQKDAEIVADTVIQLYAKWNADVILVENNATQQILVSLIRVIGEKDGFTDLPLQGRFTGQQKWSADAGLPKLNAELAQGKWVIPYAGDHTEPHHSCIICDWLNEMLYWGKLRMPNGQKPTTDIIMAMWLASTAGDTMDQFVDIPTYVETETREVKHGSPRPH